MDKAFKDLAYESEYEKVKEYFPNLFCKLSQHILYDEKYSLRKYFSQHFFAYLASTTSTNCKLMRAIKHFNASVKPDNFGYVGSYMKFKDGNIYDIDSSFDKTFFVSNLMDAARELNLTLYDLDLQQAIDYDTFRKMLLKFAKEIIDSINTESDEISSHDYAELAYLNVLCEELKSINIVEIMNTKSF